jgi:site-specific DNA-methyltransferase (adenine-specific)
MTLLHGDCLEVMRTLDENSIDTIITDPPYGLGFMGKEWDTFDKSQFGIAGNEGDNDLKVKKNFNVLPRYKTDGLYAFTLEWATEALRIAKPGAMMLCFGGTRTFHKIVSGIEDAGWEIRDTIMWVYGSGFPKSHNISKAMDKAKGAEREVIGRGNDHGHEIEKDIEQKFRFKADYNLTAPATPEAQLWDGWGTALKPAVEPICVAMKPLDGTFVNNALTWGVAGLNIDGARVEGSKQSVPMPAGGTGDIYGFKKGVGRNGKMSDNTQGRFPANLIHDGSDEVTGLFPNTGKSAGGRIGNKGSALNMMGTDYTAGDPGYGDSGSAARFFYCAKSSRRERNSGLDSTYTVKYNYDKSILGGLSWKDVSTELVQSLRKVTSDLEAMRWSIGESGENITGQCPLDSLSTILTEISKITTSQILDLLMLSPTSAFIQDANLLMENGGSLAESAESSSQLKQNTTRELTELVRGAELVVSQMLSTIKDEGNWKPLTNFHATVKPIELMRYLVRLTKTPTGGIVLDPFMGSGTTGCACELEGREFIGIEMNEEYIEIAEKRIAHWKLPLFQEVE